MQAASEHEDVLQFAGRVVGLRRRRVRAQIRLVEARQQALFLAGDYGQSALATQQLLDNYQVRRPALCICYMPSHRGFVSLRVR